MKLGEVTPWNIQSGLPDGNNLRQFLLCCSEDFDLWQQLENRLACPNPAALFIVHVIPVPTHLRWRRRRERCRCSGSWAACGCVRGEPPGWNSEEANGMDTVIVYPVDANRNTVGTIYENIKLFPPWRGIEPRSPAWQAGILTTILSRITYKL